MAHNIGVEKTPKYKEYISPEVEFKYRQRNKKDKKQTIKGGPVKKDSSKYGIRVERAHGGGVGIQTHGNKLASALNTQTPDHSVYLNEDGYLKGGIKVRS